MEPRNRQYYSLTNGIRLDNLSVPMYLGQNFGNGVAPTSVDANIDMGIDSAGGNLPTPHPVTSDFDPVSDLTHQDDLQDDDDSSDAILGYINQILMEEDFEEEGCMIQESLELQAAEKSFYEVIGKSYPPSPGENFDYSGEDLWRPNGCCSSDVCGCVDGGIGDTNSACEFSECSNSTSELVKSASTSASASWSGSSISVAKDGRLESPLSPHQSVSLFMKGIEEASRLIPNSNKLFVSSQVKGEQWCEAAADMEKKDVREEMQTGLKGKKHGNANVAELEEERSSKQAAIYDDPNVHSDVFDEILLHHAGDQNKALTTLRVTLKDEAVKKTQHNAQSKGSGGGKGSGRKQNKKKVVDLRTLLINCAQALTADDCRTANELLKQIRKHSSPVGDGNQRLAHYLANGLEARLAGTGSQIYRALMSKRTSAAGVVKAYLVYLAAAPFRKVSNLFSNRTISKLTRGAARIHIIDFGILYGFQWPSFIQRQSERLGGPPKIRVTGIDFPQPGFRPAQRVEETGRRLAYYAKEFKVPFEFNPIAKRWETIQLEDFKLEEGETVIVNCIYQMKNFPDETLVVEHSRDAILNMIRKLNPAIFIQGVVNGAYNAPFFLTRFREALFHFSSFFDMLETVMPPESEERLLVERDILGREALNVIACEGWERVERPESYKQWQARTCRAGFVQLQLDQEVTKRSKLRVNAYHREFVIDQDGQWLLLGWKGRIIYALSTWRPA